MRIILITLAGNQCHANVLAGVQSRISVVHNKVQFREGEAPFEPMVSAVQRLGRIHVRTVDIKQDQTDDHLTALDCFRVLLSNAARPSPQSGKLQRNIDTADDRLTYHLHFSIRLSI